MNMETIKIILLDCFFPCIVAILTVLIEGRIQKKSERKKQIPHMYSVKITSTDEFEVNKHRILDCKTIAQICLRQRSIDELNTKEIRFKKIKHQTLREECRKKEFLVIGFQKNVESGLVLNKLLANYGVFDIDEKLIPLMVEDRNEYCFVCEKIVAPFKIQGTFRQTPVEYEIKFQTSHICPRLKKSKR